MEMVLQQSAGSGNPGGVVPGPTRPAPPTAPKMMMMATAATKQEPEPETMEPEREQPSGGDGVEEDHVLRRGPWTVDEDMTLINYVAEHGEGRWNALARAAGLNRTGKSCRLRWLNYLRPDVKRGDFTADEQLLILDLHSRWGNRWSKIASQLPGRTDNEIKNYWRTRVQKHAKQLNCDVNSKRFKDAMRFLWMPRLAERASAAARAPTAAATMPIPTTATDAGSYDYERRSPSSSSTTTTTTSSSLTSDHSAATTAGVPTPGAGRGGDWAAMQRADDDQEFWSTASALQQLTAAGDHRSCFLQDQDQDLISGWVQGFSESEAAMVSSSDALWSLDDIWRTMHC